MPVIMRDEVTGPMAWQAINIISHKVSKWVRGRAIPWVGLKRIRLYNVLSVCPQAFSTHNKQTYT